MIKVIFFDIDDTLYDSTRLTEEARKNSIYAMIDAGLNIRDVDFLYRKLSEIIKRYGSNYPKHYDKLLEELNLRWDPKIIAAAVVAYEKTKHAYLKPYPGVISTLIELKKRYKLGIISNGLAVKQCEKLVHMNIHNFFDYIIISELVKHEKPSLEIFRIALNIADAKPEESVMVGNNPVEDIEPAKKLGMITIRIRRGKYKNLESNADFEIENFDEILNVIKIIERKK